MISIKKTLKALADKLNEPFKYRSYSFNNYDFSANQYRKLTKSGIDIDGYNSYIIGANCTSGGSILVQNAYMSSDVLNLECYNRTSSAVNSQNFTVYILHIRSDLMS